MKFVFIIIVFSYASIFNTYISACFLIYVDDAVL